MGQDAGAVGIMDQFLSNPREKAWNRILLFKKGVKSKRWI